MSNRLISFGVMLLLVAVNAGAQELPLPTSSLLKRIEPLDSGSAANSVSSSGSSNGDLHASKPDAHAADATEITATSEASFDQQTRKAVFTGNVRVKHPQFTLTAEKLTAILKKEATAAPVKAANPSSPVKTPDLPGGGGGLEKVIAEGGVVIIQDKIPTDGGEPVRYVAKAARAEYDAATGNVTLSGRPQVAQGINMQVATEDSTVMILNRDGKMSTIGGSKTLIQDTGKNNQKP